MPTLTAFRLRFHFNHGLLALLCLSMLISPGLTGARALAGSDALAALTGDPDAPAMFNRAWTIGGWYEEGATVGLELGDFDGDGVNEVLDASSSRWKVFSYDTASHRYQPEYLSKDYPYEPFVPGIRCIGAAELPAGYQIFVITGAGRLEVYNDDYRLSALADVGWPAATCRRLLIRDTDQDGALELVVKTEYGLAVLSAETYTLEWATGQAYEEAMGSSAMTVGNTDDDAALEIITSTRMFDGITHALEWQPVDFIAYTLATADIDGDGRDEVIGSRGYEIDAYDAETQRYKWIIYTPYEWYDTFTTADIDADGVIEIIAGNDQSGWIQVYNSATRVLKWQVGNPGHGTTRLVSGNIDGDPALELVWGTNAGTTAPDNLVIADTATHAVEWTSPESGSYNDTQAGDVDADGQMEVVVGGCSMDSGVLGAPPMVLDAQTRQVEWSGPSPADPYGCPGKTPVHLANIDQDAPLEILYNSTGSLRAVDGSTHQLQWEWKNTDDINNHYYQITAIQSADVDLDGQLEVVIAVDSTMQGVAGPYLYVLTPGASAVEWKSPLLVPAYSNGNAAGLALCDLDDDPALEIVAVTSQAWAFDGASHATQWNNTSLYALSAACGDIDGDGQAEVIAGHADGKISIANGQTGQVEGTQTLFTPAKGVVALRLADINQDGVLELLAASNSLLAVFRASDFQKLWQSQPLGPESRVLRGPLALVDLDGDAQAEILFGTELSLTAFKLNPNTQFTLDVYPTVPAAAPGGPAPFRVDLENQSDQAHEYVVTVGLTADGLSGAPAATAGTTSLSGQTLTWTVTLPGYAMAQMTFSALASADAPHGSALLLTAHAVEPASGIVREMQASVEIDAAAPVSSIILPLADGALSGEQAVISGSATDEHGVARVEVSIDGGAWQSAAGLSRWNFTWTLPGDGAHQIRTRAVDRLGNQETPAPARIFYISNLGPVVQQVTPAEGSQNVLEFAPLEITFNVPVQPGSLVITCQPDIIFGPAEPGASSLSALAWHVTRFPTGQSVSCTVTGVLSTTQHPLTIPYTWSFTANVSPIRIFLPGVSR